MKITTMNQCDQKMIKNVANLYCRIWKEPPWNEGFWIERDVMADIMEQFEKPKAIFITAIDNGLVIGFTWGYEVDKKEMRKISHGNKLDAIFCDQTTLFYVDELAVDSKFRNKGVGRLLTGKLIKQSSKYRITGWSLRTHKDAIKAKRLYKQIGFNNLEIADERYKERAYWLLRK